MLEKSAYIPQKKGKMIGSKRSKTPLLLNNK